MKTQFPVNIEVKIYDQMNEYLRINNLNNRSEYIVGLIQDNLKKHLKSENAQSKNK